MIAGRQRRSELIADAVVQVALLPQPKGRRMPVAGPVTTTHAEADEPSLPDPESFDFGDPTAAHKT